MRRVEKRLSIIEENSHEKTSLGFAEHRTYQSSIVAAAAFIGAQ
jgi:hypothetical protein